MPPSSTPLSTALSGAKTVLLESRRGDGTWVPTPVSLAAADGRLYLRTYDRSGKAKRLRNRPEVRITPCTFLGRPTGTPVEARVRLLDGEEARQARRLLARRFPVLHGLAVPLTHRVKGYVTLHYELEPPA